MRPLIVKSTLTDPPRWYVATRYRQKTGGIDVTTGKPASYLVAQTKYDVTDQMEAILAAALMKRRQESARDGQRTRAISKAIQAFRHIMKMIQTEQLIPESVSYMREARKALTMLDGKGSWECVGDRHES
jgi:hypothetical protein